MRKALVLVAAGDEEHSCAVGGSCDDGAGCDAANHALGAGGLLLLWTTEDVTTATGVAPVALVLVTASADWSVGSACASAGKERNGCVDMGGDGVDWNLVLVAWCIMVKRGIWVVD